MAEGSQCLSTQMAMPGSSRLPNLFTTALLEAAAIWASSCVHQSALFQVRGPSAVCVSRPGLTPNHSPYTSLPHTHTEAHMRTHVHAHATQPSAGPPAFLFALQLLKHVCSLSCQTSSSLQAETQRTLCSEPPMGARSPAVTLDQECLSNWVELLE